MRKDIVVEYEGVVFPIEYQYADEIFNSNLGAGDHEEIAQLFAGYRAQLLNNESHIPPPLTESEQWNARVYLAISHEDGKCHIYEDDGELQCGNVTRHGRSIDFRREPFQDLLDIVGATRMKETQLAMGEKPSPKEILDGMQKLSDDIRKGKKGTVVI
jgi:hypothetical protein